MAEPRLIPSNWNWTDEIPTLSEVADVILTVLDNVAPEAGDVIETVGGVVSEEGGVPEVCSFPVV